MKRDKCIPNAKFNLLTIMELPFSEKKGRYTIWKCKCICDCGQEKIVRCDALINETIKSCGCYNKIAASSRMKVYNTKYDEGIINHPLYQSYIRMKNVCHNKNDAKYIGDKIKICKDWLDSYQTFYEWGLLSWKDGYRLRRKNINKNFTPENCFFQDKKEIIIENIDIEKAKNTCIKKYGVSSYTQTNEYIEKSKKSNLEKYGFEWHTQNEDVKQKSKNTCFERYGQSSASKTDEVKEKIRQTCLKKYGTNSPSQNPEIFQKQMDRNIEKYGQPFYNRSNLKTQNSIKEWLKTEGFEFDSNYDIIKGKEIDLYNKELKLAIEYCGLYWHTQTRVGNNNHNKKYKECKKQNIQLLTIFSDEWMLRQQQCKNFILSILGKNNKIFARKCIVKEIDKKEAKVFLEKYHIQGGKNNSKFCVGLFYNEELVGVTTFSTHHRNSQDFVLNRMAFKAGIQVIGGASKMLKLGINYCKENNINKIITWSDNRWSTGKMYETIGFKLEKELNPDYSYIKLSSPKQRISKQSCTKSKINCPKEKTEYEYMIELGYDRIWDCGKKRFILDIGV